MKIVIEAGLPPDGLAVSTAKALQKQHPWLVSLLAGRQATQTQWRWQEQGCTPSEGLTLTLAHCPTLGEHPIGSALGPYLANVTTPEQTVWLADMCHTAISQDKAALIALPDLSISRAESEALFEGAAPLFDGGADGFTIEPIDVGRWRVTGNLPPPSKVISPTALSGRDVGDWWPTGTDWRPWRRLLNELQMVWHEHPINEARETAGRPAINGVWLYGGAKGWQPQPVEDVQWCDNLKSAAKVGDWHQWLQDWQALQNTLLATDPETAIVLLGDDRWVSLQRAPKTWWRALLGLDQKNAWMKWWAKQ